MEDELKIARKEAFSLKGPSSGMQKIGAVENGNKLNYFYRDQKGKYWYESKFKKDGKIISDTEYIFGKIPESVKREEKRKKDIKWNLLRKYGKTG